MCLTVRRFHVSKARKNIPCYKVLNKEGRKLFTPYRRVPFTEVPLEKDAPDTNWGIPFLTEIGIGYIHVFKENPQYKYAKKKGIKVERYNAYIPKGTKYWKGIQPHGESGYASKEVKLNFVTE